MEPFSVTGETYGIDLELFEPGVVTAYVLNDDEPTLIDTGYANGTDQLLNGLETLGIEPSSLSNAIVSHIHLDHAGGAAELVEHAPDIDVYVHEMTGTFLTDPERLIESSRRAMGDHFEAVGGPEPLPERNLVEVDGEGETVDTGSRTLELIPTPGHAPDHLSVWDPTTESLFANESFASYYPKADTWLPPGTFPNFDVELVDETMNTLSALEPAKMTLSHAGVVPEPESAFDIVRKRIEEFADRIPAIYEEQGDDLEATERVVERDLLDLGNAYGADLVSFEAKFQTRGFLMDAGVID